MQIDPAALGAPEAADHDPVPPARPAAPGTPPVIQKTSKALISVPRLDLEPLYSDLKTAIGENWSQYKEATALFLLGTSSCAMEVRG
jgi:transcriptional coactivator HFI1/ADA1